MLKRAAALFAIAAGTLSFPLHAQQPSPPKHEIVIAKFSFTPARLIVQQGDVVEWVNRDAVRHDASAVNRSWKTGTIKPGATGKFTATTPGTFDYICSRHPHMKATIVVESPKPASPPG